MEFSQLSIPQGEQVIYSEELKLDCNRETISHILTMRLELFEE